MDIRHECGSLFMPGRDQSDRGIGKRIHEAEGFFTWEGKQVPNSFILQAPNQQLSHIHAMRTPIS